MTARPLPPERITVRRLTVEDAEEYRSFRLEALRHAPSAFTSSYGEESTKPLSATIERLAAVGRPHDAVVGAFDSGSNLLGIAGLAVPARRQERHKATLFGMAVAPHATGQGIGKVLVRRVLDLAAAIDGVVQVCLTVSEGNLPAERLYSSCGFQVWGREPRAVIIDGTAIAKLHMVRMLDDPARL
ncbi:GNAT family N-acetyltransferase [Nonomuraea sp. CA-141351]|uniref:GNAT family N-acetyltransferase n=1 Tax=Nonomuraea sp. CA-141351 TaxID=3239996 RepID=UPI003D8CA5E2